MQASAQTDLKNYQQIPDSMRRRENLVKYVVPDKNYTYWEFDRTEWDTTKSGEVLFSRGKRPDNIVIKSTKSMLFAWGWPAGLTAYYIAYVDNGKLSYITTEQQFISFMGHVDNLQEAIFLAMLKENLVADDKKIGGAYRIIPNGYDLMLMKYNQCPETKQAIQVIVRPEGVIKKIPHRVYFYSKNCPVI